MDRKAHKLPLRSQPAHHQNERIKKQVGSRSELRVEHHLDRLKRTVTERFDVRRQLRGKMRKRIARMQYADQRLNVFQGARGAQMAGEPAALLLIARHFCQRALHRLHRAILKGAHEQIQLIHLACAQRGLHASTVRLRIGLHHWG